MLEHANIGDVSSLQGQIGALETIHLPNGVLDLKFTALEDEDKVV